MRFSSSELDEGTDCRKSSYLLVKTMVSCKIDMNPLTARIPQLSPILATDLSLLVHIKHRVSPYIVTPQKMPENIARMLNRYCLPLHFQVSNYSPAFWCCKSTQRLSSSWPGIESFGSIAVSPRRSCSAHGAMRWWVEWCRLSSLVMYAI